MFRLQIVFCGCGMLEHCDSASAYSVTFATSNNSNAKKACVCSHFAATSSCTKAGFHKHHSHQVQNRPTPEVNNPVCDRCFDSDRGIPLHSHLIRFKPNGLSKERLPTELIESTNTWPLTPEPAHLNSNGNWHLQSFSNLSRNVLLCLVGQLCI